MPARPEPLPPATAFRQTSTTTEPPTCFHHRRFSVRLLDLLGVQTGTDLAHLRRQRHPSLMKLVLFDIDGTLIRDDGAARDAFAEALAEVYDLEPELDRFDFSGRTDPEITWMVLEGSGISDHEIESRLDALWISYIRGLQERISRDRVRLMPGIGELLDILSRDPGITLALLTGNIEPGARTKLAPFDLNRYFSFGAFGSDSRFRNELPPVAAQRARQHLGRDFDMADLVIIGDSIYDIRCTVPHGARSIAVATGITPAEMLLAEEPDHFFPTLEEIDDVVEAIHA